MCVCIPLQSMKECLVDMCVLCIFMCVSDENVHERVFVHICVNVYMFVISMLWRNCPIRVSPSAFSL